MTTSLGSYRVLPHAKPSPFECSSLSSGSDEIPEECKVVFLPNDHDNPAHFEFQAKIIDRYFDPRTDILLLEAPEGSDHFEEKRAKFEAACQKTIVVAGWVEPRAFHQALVLRSIYRATRIFNEPEGFDSASVKMAKSILGEAIGDVDSEAELLDRSIQFVESDRFIKHTYTCLTYYQSSLINKIKECCSLSQRVFVDVGLMHVNEKTAVAEGYEGFLPQISRLKTTIAGRRPIYLCPPVLATDRFKSI